tara:strand:- start:2050 stop:3471 length:1422 start_codon:yes stop_codon:yes gene_type:complete
MSSGNTIKFGTDGWRARIAHDYTFENIRKVAKGISAYLHNHGLNKKSLIVGYDSRFASYEFASEVARITSAAGIHTLISENIVPTPAVSYNILNNGAGAGIVITASHNSWEWNGLKFKPSFGGSAPPDVVAEIESLIENPLLDNLVPQKHIENYLPDLVDLKTPYLSKLSNSVNLRLIKESGLRVLIDSMHGSGSGYLRSILENSDTTIKEIRNDRNPIFPDMKQPEPIEQNLQPTIHIIKNSNYDVALANDGDADRLGVLDENGKYIDTLAIFSLLCLHQFEYRKQKGTIVRSITQSNMINKLANMYGSQVVTTPVGFKFLGPAMIEHDAIAAGEESGGYAFKGNIPERDGLLSGLLFLELMALTGQRASELVKYLHQKVGEHYYDRVDLVTETASKQLNLARFKESLPTSLGGLAVMEANLTDGLLFSLENGFWGLIRQSGTEPLIRLYAEGDSPARVQEILTSLQDLIYH